VSNKSPRVRRTPTPVFAVISFIVVIAVLVIMINLGADTTMSVFAGAVVSVIIAVILAVP